VGANLVRHLLARGVEVVAVSQSEAPGWRLRDVADDVRFVQADLRDAEAAGAAVRGARASWIFHLAAHGGYSWERDRRVILQTNFTGTVSVLEAAVAEGFEAFVHAGSSSEYGPKDHPASEIEVLDPDSDYAVGKAAATQFCRHIARANDVHAVTLRLYSAYGPWEEPNRLVPTLLVNAVAGGLPPLVNPDVARDFVYVDDVCEAFLAAADAVSVPRGSVYNVGTGRQTTIAEMVAVVRDLLGIDAEPEWGSMPNRQWDTQIWVADPSLIRRELGWTASTELRVGLERTAEWLRESGQHDVYRKAIA
jgi:UDP-glucose 4-epimerase